MTLQVVKLFLPDGDEYWCQRSEMEAVLAAMDRAHPEWKGKRFSAEQVEMEAADYYRRPASNGTINDALAATDARSLVIGWRAWAPNGQPRIATGTVSRPL